MIDYILDNMIVNKRAQHKKVRQLRIKGFIEYTICEEIAHEQRLASDLVEREAIKKESKSLERVTDFAQLADIANEMIDRSVLDLDEGGGDVMVAYEALVNEIPNLFITERTVVSDDKGLTDFCKSHDIRIIDSNEYSLVIKSFESDNETSVDG